MAVISPPTFARRASRQSIPGCSNAVGHRSNGESQGQKTDAWDGGHRAPFLARWPGRIPAGATSNGLFGLNDIMATSIAAAGLTMPDRAGPDSLNLLPVLEGKTPSPRTEMVYQGVLGLGLRQGPWVYFPTQGSLGFTTRGQFGVAFRKMEFQNDSLDADGKPLPDAPPDQLYNIEEDPAQQRNVIKQHPEVAQKMAARLTEITGPNPPQIVGSPKKAKKQP